MRAVTASFRAGFGIVGMPTVAADPEASHTALVYRCGVARRGCEGTSGIDQRHELGADGHCV